MTRRLATICLMTISLFGLSSPPNQAQDIDPDRDTLKGISAVWVLVDELPPIAKVLGLSKDTIRTDVELKLRLGEMRVVPLGELSKVPGGPLIFVDVNLTDDAEAANIEVELRQNASLVRNHQPGFEVSTWRIEQLISHPTAQGIRDGVKDCIDKFLNAWLTVNPKK
jgi:hypothetical protein